MKIIGITQRMQKITKYNEYRDQIDNKLNSFVIKAGYIPVPIPNFKLDNKKDNKILIHWLKKVNPSGIILSGGDDYGAYKIRDKNEIRIIRWSILKKIPMLGICRGMQIINKYFGGTKIKIKNHTGKKHKILGDHCKFRKNVNSFHNWGFNKKNISGKFHIKSMAEDKTIESIKHKKYNINGIMWHPEREIKFKKDDLLLMNSIFN